MSGDPEVTLATESSQIAASQGPPETVLDALRLGLVPGIGPRLTQQLLERFGTPQGVLTASITDLQRTPGIGPKLAMSITTHGHRALALEEWARIQAANATLFQRRTPAYPTGLEQIPDPPELLYCRGTMIPADHLAIAIVGSRSCTLYGRQQAERIAGGLARAGITVVSGLARGIDAAAHHGALAAGGRTLAVCATGLSVVYPPEHVELADAVAKQGALLTESPMLQAPVPGLFPQRNRIISGLSLGTIVIEAGRRSGALHTARHATEQNREVFALPGRVDSEPSLGCLDLIRDGATLIRDVDDVLSALGPLTKPVPISPKETVHHPVELQLSEQERTVLNLITAEPRPVDDVLRSAELDQSRVLSTLTVLEMRRLIRRLPGGFVARY